MGTSHKQGFPGRLCWATDISRRGLPAGRLNPIGRTDKAGTLGAADTRRTRDILGKTVNSASSGPDARNGGDHVSSCGYHPVGWRRSEAALDSLNLCFPRKQVGREFFRRDAHRIIPGESNPRGHTRPSPQTEGNQKVCLAERRQPSCWLACLPVALAATSLKFGERESASMTLGHRRRRRLPVHNRRSTPKRRARLWAAIRRLPEVLALLRMGRTSKGFGWKPINGTHLRPSGLHPAVHVRGSDRSILGRNRRSSRRCFSRISPAAAP